MLRPHQVACWGLTEEERREAEADWASERRQDAADADREDEDDARN